MAAKDQTFNDFTGGLNLTEDRLYMNAKYSPVFRNMRFSVTGNPAVRYGFRMVKDIEPTTVGLPGLPLAIIYGFEAFDHDICILNQGSIIIVNKASNAASVLQIGGADSWTGGGSVLFATHCLFGNRAIVTCDAAKPIEIWDNAGTITCDLLSQAGGGNADVPNATFCATVNDYLVLAGFADGNHTHGRYGVSISGKGGADKWESPAPGATQGNIELDTSTYFQDTVSNGISAIAEYRNKLIVFTARESLRFQLGTEVANVHTPTPDDSIGGFGCIAHNTLCDVGSTKICADYQGIVSITQSTSGGGILTPKYVSNQIYPDLISDLGRRLPPTSELRSYAYKLFSVWNEHERSYLLCVPYAGITDLRSKIWAYAVPQNRVTEAWSVWDGGDRDPSLGNGFSFTSSWNSSRGGVQFAGGDGQGLSNEVSLKIYKWGDYFDPVHVDYKDDPLRDSGTGFAIQFDWCTANIDFGSRIKGKSTHYMRMDLHHYDEDGNLIVEMYTDRELATPALAFPAMVRGKESPTLSSIDPIDYEYLTDWPAQFNTMFMRAYGHAWKQTEFVSYTFVYSVIGIKR